MAERRKFIAGNWKMHGLGSSVSEIGPIAAAADALDGVDVALCVPATLIHRAAKAAPTLSIGAQDCHQEDAGAHTGCISAAMLAEVGATLTIVGHSERRQDQHESDADIKAKAEAARAAGLSVMETTVENDVEIEAACEGSLACATCHMVVEDQDWYEKLDPPSEDEEDMLDLAFDLRKCSRLGCQIIMDEEKDGLTVALPGTKVDW